MTNMWTGVQIFRASSSTIAFSSPSLVSKMAMVRYYASQSAGKVPLVGARIDPIARPDPTLNVTDNPQSEIQDDILRLTSGKAVSVVTNFATLGDPKGARNLHLSILRGDYMRWRSRRDEVQ
ncbi:hypothetical protein PoB_000550900 [Plakobranchus ocellatus]|uniref:Uncharacterized protein n=1 Tax=Plakobranchus ocellatus TaxID=259542 RepID=A0AAV3Y7V6_9GAST|nr:hypothetical protein PoB_000550900 [Plakobranchus ocellatus]